MQMILMQKKLIIANMFYVKNPVLLSINIMNIIPAECLLGESIEVIQNKVKEKRCAVPKVINDLGALKSSSKDNISDPKKMKKVTKESKKKQSDAKNKRNKQFFEILKNTFTDTDDSYSESNKSSQSVTTNASLLNVSVRLEKLNDLHASQPPNLTLQKNVHSQNSQRVNELDNLSDLLPSDTESHQSAASSVQDTAASSPPKNKFKNRFQHKSLS
ncbi:uncharacterized protein LOC116418291 [Nasonia vitripennis]|uniref:Uncharacterized protein n=1 Tax=Nasonia vitripennis TaxID=7425 RepID=A0A7M7QN33_NASVI|nr:uncharacterized protein LOC116418291 [Nasonia vitripennis]